MARLEQRHHVIYDTQWRRLGDDRESSTLTDQIVCVLNFVDENYLSIGILRGKKLQNYLAPTAHLKMSLSLTRNRAKEANIF